MLHQNSVMKQYKYSAVPYSLDMVQTILAHFQGLFMSYKRFVLHKNIYTCSRTKLYISGFCICDVTVLIMNDPFVQEVSLTFCSIKNNLILKLSCHLADTSSL
jgi:hypothetical protein